MAFPKQDLKPFTRWNIERLSRGQMGCYGIYQQEGAWVYIGKGDIRQRLLDHLNGDNTCITRHGPTHWVDIVTDRYDTVEKQLLSEYETLCNKRIG